jgi:phosphatidylglycerophosphatase A
MALSILKQVIFVVEVTLLTVRAPKHIIVDEVVTYFLVAEYTLPILGFIMKFTYIFAITQFQTPSVKIHLAVRQ